MQRVEITAEHLPRMVELERILFPGDSPWTLADFQAELAQPHTVYIGVVSEGELLGYGGLAVMGPADEPECEIHTIGVDPAYQRRGVATSIMDNFVEIASRLRAPTFLEVRHDNEPAIALYTRYGFTPQSVRRNYYQPSGADALVMRRDPDANAHGPRPDSTQPSSSPRHSHETTAPTPRSAQRAVKGSN